MLYDIYQAALLHPDLQGIPQLYGPASLHTVGDVPRIHWVPTEDIYEGPVVGDWKVPAALPAPCSIAGADANGGLNYSLRTAAPAHIAQVNLGPNQLLGVVEEDGSYAVVLRTDGEAREQSTALEVAAAVAAHAGAGPLLSAVPTGDGSGIAKPSKVTKVRAIRTRWAGCELELLAADWRPMERLINQVQLALQDLAMGFLRRLGGEWTARENLSANCGHILKVAFGVPIFRQLPTGTILRVAVAPPQS